MLHQYELLQVKSRAKGDCLKSLSEGWGQVQVAVEDYQPTKEDSFIGTSVGSLMLPDNSKKEEGLAD